VDLTIDAGNSAIKFGLFENSRLISAFETKTAPSLKPEDFADLFQKNVCCKIERTICSSVVPQINSTIKLSISQIFGIETLFLQTDIFSKLKIQYNPPSGVGADRIAAAAGAVSLMPGQNLIVIDMGTATTIDAVLHGEEFAGGTIMPGIGLAVRSLATGTAKLPAIKIERPTKACGTCTAEAIKSGIFYSQAGAIKEICRLFQQQVFSGEQPYIIATGGAAQLFENEGIFDKYVSELVLIGLQKILELN